MMVSREADVFIIGAGECGSNLVGSYIQQSKKQTGASRIRDFPYDKFHIFTSVIRPFSPSFRLSAWFRRGGRG